MLATWTDQGVRNEPQSAKRLDGAKKLLIDMGGNFKSILLTMGEFDLVMVYEAR